MFVNRDRELQVLEERYASGQAELIIPYGRRRVGKTALLRKFCQDKPHIFYTADLASEGEHLAEFSRLMAQATGMEPEVAPIYPSWRAALTALAALPESEWWSSWMSSPISLKSRRRSPRCFRRFGTTSSSTRRSCSSSAAATSA